MRKQTTWSKTSQKPHRPLSQTRCADGECACRKDAPPRRLSEDAPPCRLSEDAPPCRLSEDAPPRRLSEDAPLCRLSEDAPPCRLPGRRESEHSETALHTCQHGRDPEHRQRQGREDVGQRFSFVAHGAATLEDSWAVSWKTKHTLTTWPTSCDS